jgi:hypothetical protein
MPDITITVTAEQATRIRVAFGQLKNLGRDATTQEAIGYVRDYLKEMVLRQERIAIEKAIAQTPFD